MGGAVLAVIALLALIWWEPAGDPSAEVSTNSPSPVAASGSGTPSPTGSATEDRSASPSPSRSEASASPSPGIDPAKAEKAALAALEGFLRTSQAALADPEEPIDPVTKFAVGAALGEVEAQTQEFVDLGVRIKGTSTVASTDVEDVDLSADPPRIVISMCLDESSVTTISPEYPDGVTQDKRTTNVYVVEFHDRAWKVAEHSFPDTADCS